MAKLVSDRQRQIAQVINHLILCGIISLFGVMSNIINLTVFYKKVFMHKHTFLCPDHL